MNNEECMPFRSLESKEQKLTTRESCKCFFVEMQRRIL